jgi:hypothetical protein
LSLEAGSVVLEDVLLEGNQAVGGTILSHFYGAGTGAGGALWNQGNIQMRRCTLQHNASLDGNLEHGGPGASGGAIHNLGELSLRDCLIDSNSTMGGTGGIGSFGFGDNPGLGRGGGLWNGGSANLLNCTFDGNRAVGGEGTYQGTFNPQGGWHGFGGALFNLGTLVGTNLTLAGNAATGGNSMYVSGGDAAGGGLFNQDGRVDLSSVTIANNTAQGGTGSTNGASLGGGICATGGVVTLRNSIVANSPAGSNCFGAITDGGHNLSSDSSCHFNGAGSLNNTDPKLGPLADYGGPTPTMALLAGSPAVDAADAASCPATDQRGRSRPFGAGCDIAAFESSPPYTILGQIQGYIAAPSGIHITAGTSSSHPDVNGQYGFHGFSAGSYLVEPTCPEAVFVLSNRQVSLGPDAVAVDFHSYRSNALTIERVSAGSVHSIFAGEAGQSYCVEISTNLPNWSPYATNTAQSSGLFEFYETNAVPEVPRLFRVARP